jgi:serine protease Do
MTLSDSTRGLLASLSDDLAAAVARAGRSVVAVHGRRRFPASGIAWSVDRVITASHVLERDTELSITTADGTQKPARLLGRDPGADLAVLAIEDGGLEPLERALARPKAGNLLVAVGRPGTPEPIASFGAVSSSGGPWRTAQGGVLDSYLRADVALLPGLSGGALSDAEGRIVGMLSAYLAGGDPVGIPVDTIDAIVERILSGRPQRRAYLGVSTQAVELQEALRSRLGLSQSIGLMLFGIEPESPADRGGMLLGDILLRIGERAIEDAEDLQMALGPEVVGQPTLIRVVRGGEVRELSVTPGPRP